MNRRKFLTSVIGAGAAASLGNISDLLAKTSPASETTAGTGHRKLIIVIFGGGTRSSESIDDPQHSYIPRLWNEMVPRGTLFTNMRVEHKVVHPNCTGSILTGHWAWDDNDWSKPLAHPTIFEICRKERGVPDTAAWAFVYASILSNTGLSLASGYGRQFAANVVEPPTIPRSVADQMSKRMYRAAALGSARAEISAAYQCGQLARSASTLSRTGLRSETARTFIDSEYKAWKSGTGTTSHDTFLTERAINCMHMFAPNVMVVAYGEIDCAHYGSWSRYVEAIRRTDKLTWQLWQAAEKLEDYRDQTLMLILPDHGRELDGPDHWGFIHHSNFYTNDGADEGCRRVWMLAMGPNVPAGRTIAEPVRTTAVAATGLEYLGLAASPGAAISVLPLII